MIKVIAASVISVLLIQLLKNYKSEYALILKLCCICFIGFIILNEFKNDSVVFSFISEIDYSSISYLPILIKTLGIVIVTQIASDICRDSGEEALSTVTQLVGKVFILISCIPIMEALFTLVKGYLEL